jgi:hypothetical protein
MKSGKAPSQLIRRSCNRRVRSRLVRSMEKRLCATRAPRVVLWLGTGQPDDALFRVIAEIPWNGCKRQLSEKCAILRSGPPLPTKFVAARAAILVSRSRAMHSHGEMTACPETGTANACTTLWCYKTFLDLPLEFSNILPRHPISSVHVKQDESLVAEETCTICPKRTGYNELLC